MGTVSATIAVPFATSEVEALWYDPQRWPSVLDGFGRLDVIDKAWPATGTRARWASTPGGRGEVIERVQEHEARVRCVTEVEDETIHGTQTITFTPTDGGTTVQLALSYAIKQRHAFTPVMDLLFIRRAQRDALSRTLRRLAIELRSDHELGG